MIEEDDDIQIPSSSSSLLFFPNNDDLERSQSRAAALRRKPYRPPPSMPSSGGTDFIDREQLLDLYNNCVKLAADNKINQSNTWELPLIDHISEIVKFKVEEEEEGEEMNFRKASCAIEAGVRIYALRVDSVYTRAYRVLGGINRAASGGGGEHLSSECISNSRGNHSEKTRDRKICPFSTVESSFEVLNVKKVDVAFTVDPLYHQMSGQFDEGGAKGLLLNNLGIYGDCMIHFDSSEVPEKSILRAALRNETQAIDLSFAKEDIEAMVVHVVSEKDISPSLRDIVNQFRDNGSTYLPSVAQEVIQDDEVHENHSNLPGSIFNDCPTWDSTNQDHGLSDDNFTCTNPNLTGHQEKGDDYIPREQYNDAKIADFLSSSLGFRSRCNAWAGPDHWKFQKGKEHSGVVDDECKMETKQTRSRKLDVCDLELTKYIDKEMLDIFTLPKDPKSTILPVKREPCHIKLPEDLHYKPDNLVRLFILPNLMCLKREGQRMLDDSGQQSYFNSEWDNGSMTNDQLDDECIDDFVNDSETLVSLPPQVNKVSIQYDKVSKQVDVHELKKNLWSHIQESVQMADMECNATVSFRHVLHHFSSDCTSTDAASPAKDISPHLFFICLLHLANEHHLSLHGSPSLDELNITIPRSPAVK